MPPLEAKIDKFNASLIRFNRPVSLVEAIDFLWGQGHTPRSADALRPDINERAVNGRQRNFIINTQDPDVLSALHHGLNIVLVRRMRHLEPGRKQRVREGQTFQRLRAAGTTDAAWNVDHHASWPEIRRLLDAERGNIDLGYLLGWIDQESGGLVDTQHPGDSKDEVSLLQISREERGNLGINTAAMRQRLLTDLRTAVREGLQLVRLLKQRLIRNGFTENSPALWQFVRLMHMVGETATEHWIVRLKSEFDLGRGVNPFTDTWEMIQEHARVHHQDRFPIARLRIVDIMIERGAVIRDRLDAARAPQRR